MRKIRSRIRLEDEVYEELARRSSEKHLPVTAYVRMVVLEYIGQNSSEKLPEVDDGVLAMLPELRPDALVYSVPSTTIKIVASEHEDGWKGVSFDQSKSGTLFAWTSEDLNIPAWMKTSFGRIAIRFVASRIDDGALSHFRVPDSRLIVSAEWKSEDRRWGSGFVTNPEAGKTQVWERSGWFSSMGPGPFNQNAPLRRLQNTLCRTLSVRDGGLELTI